MDATTHLTGRKADLAPGLSVQRLLPSALRRSVGPFIFFDHFGPAHLAPDQDADVGAHPHIGLATVTYLFEGRQMHRDSLGTVQAIKPGDVNWMTAGKGIVHSERAMEDDRGQERPVHGLQLWVALPPELEDCEPAFQHVGAQYIPEFEVGPGATARLLVGEAWGQTSPVKTASTTLYLDVTVQPQGEFQLPTLAEEVAIYGVNTAWSLNGAPVQPNEMVVLDSSTTFSVAGGTEGARLVIIGGAKLERPVRMWWNYVSTDVERIAAAARRWSADEFPRIPGEVDRIIGPTWKERPHG